MRPAAVAGRFYAAKSTELAQQVDRMLDLSRLRNAGNSVQEGESGAVPKALVVPHAGFRYSGEIAASAYQTLQAARRRITRVVLVGPAHRVRLQGIAISGADYFATPLGRIPVDTNTVRQCVTRFDFAAINNVAHRDEHSLEAQLPFLQRCLDQFSLVPIAVGDATPEQVAKCLAYLWGQEETLILISSDLSHYHSYIEAKKLDQFTSDAITRLDPGPISYEHACGQVGVRGLLHMARAYKLTAELLDLRNSGDTSERKDQVVGYGSYAFYPPGRRFNRQQRARLSQVAGASIRHGLIHGKPLLPDADSGDAMLLESGASFVTLNSTEGKLRGCIGTLTSDIPLIRNVAANAFKAAFSDQRFKPLTEAELGTTRLEISVLSPSEKIHGDTEDAIRSQLRPFVDGLILTEQGRRGTFLPTVWKIIPDPATFLQQLKRKAGLEEDYWSAHIEIYRYQTESW